VTPPKRTALELARDLRIRAAHLSGQAFEVPATAAMMNEAADLLEALAKASPGGGPTPAQED
jgi:hypothetical protein